MKRRETLVARRTDRGVAAVWFVAIAALLLVVALLVVLIVVLLTRPVAAPTSTNSTKPTQPWSAVLLADNEIFFGHIKALNPDHIELTDVYFVQKSASTTATNAPLSIVSLVANQIQCPENDISINRGSILYWENLQTKSFVVQRLNQLVQTPQNCFEPPTASPTP